MNRYVISTFAAAALLTIGQIGPAQAALVNVNFTVGIDSGPFKNRSYTGRFAYEGSQTPGRNIFGETTFALASFSFVFEGLTANLTSFNTPTFWTLPQGEIPGLDGTAPTFTFNAGLGGFAPTFAYDRGQGVAGFGTVVFAPAISLPEPATAALVLVALGWLRRNRSYLHQSA